jgi:site-specific recombinase XerD
MVPKVAHRPAGLPRGLSPAQVDAVLTCCEPTSVAGLHGYAMLTLMARLGLRCVEAAGLVGAENPSVQVKRRVRTHGGVR